MLFDLASLPTAAIIAIFAAAAVMVWIAGTRLTGYVNGISKKTNIGQAFAGMLLLGGITSLPEVATVSTASAMGNAPLAVNNLLGTASMNVLLLAVADIIYGRGALTVVAARPVTLMQGILSMFLMILVAVIATLGDIQIWQVGAGATVLLLVAIAALRLTSTFEQRHVWEVVDEDEDGEGETSLPGKRKEEPEERPRSTLIIRTASAAAVILFAGYFLSRTGEDIANRTGIGLSMVGFTLLALATSLPEISSITAALRMRRYELAVGDIFGTNIFNMALIFLADLVYVGEPVLAGTKAFEVVGALLAALLTAVFVIGLLARRSQSIFRMGYDSLTAIILFGGGLYFLSGLM